jgi:hypothetical protein
MIKDVNRYIDRLLQLKIFSILRNFEMKKGENDGRERTDKKRDRRIPEN